MVFTVVILLVGFWWLNRQQGASGQDVKALGTMQTWLAELARSIEAQFNPPGAPVTVGEAVDRCYGDDEGVSLDPYLTGVRMGVEPPPSLDLSSLRTGPTQAEYDAWRFQRYVDPTRRTDAGLLSRPGPLQLVP